MESQFPDYSVRTFELLTKVRELGVRRRNLEETDATSTTAAVHLQSEIFRRSLLIQSILRSESGRDNLTDDAKDLLEKTRSQVLQALTNEKATVEDLKSFPIPPLMTDPDSMGEKSSFHQYLDLPPIVVREHILGYLITLQDKLNLLQAIPSEEPLMTCQKSALHFEAVLRVLMERQYISWGSMYNVSRVNTHFGGVVNSFLEEIKMGTLRRLDYQGHFGHSPLLEDLISKLTGEEEGERWSRRLNPATRIMLESLGVEGNGEIMQFLRRFGGRIWECAIEIFEEEASPLEFLKTVCACLDLMPNLRKLEIVGGWHHDAGRDDEVPKVDFHTELAKLDGVQLPELRHLQSLVLKFHSPELMPVARKLLEKYAETLRHVNFYLRFPLEGPVGGFNLPFLSTLTIYREYQASWQRLLENLTLFCKLSLKTVRVNVSGPSTYLRQSTLLTLLSRLCGGTLEHLELSLASSYGSRQGLAKPPRPDSSAWMLDLAFPKLKHLRLGGDFGREEDGFGAQFLLMFPALESLDIEEMEQLLMRPGTVMHGTLHLSVRFEEMLTSLVWKVLPKLERIMLGQRMHAPESQWVITRKECLHFQKNGVRMVRGAGPTNFLEGDWNAPPESDEEEEVQEHVEVDWGSESEDDLEGMWGNGGDGEEGSDDDDAV